LEKNMKSEKNTGKTMVFNRENDPPGGNLLGHLWASIGVTIVLGIICCGIYPFLIWGISQLAFPIQANGSLLKKDGSFTTDDTQAVGSALIDQNFSLPQYFHPRPSAAGSGYDPTSSGGSNQGPLSDKLINGLTTPATTQPTTQPESLSFDGVRLRTLHYATDNSLSFKLYNQRSDGTGDKAEVPIKQFEDAQGNLLDVKLVDAFPHPPSDTPDRIVLTAGPFTDSQGKDVLIPGDAVTASGSGLDPHISPANAELQIGRVAAARHISADQTKALIQQFTDGPDLGFLGDPGVNVLRLNLALDAKYPMPSSK
jgi:potassium-transporting ATPase KdpC subunit